MVHPRAGPQSTGGRIEAPRDRLQDLLRLSDGENLVPTLLNLGFTSVSLDLEGLVSGKLNRAVSP